jgi:hypothetical protein
MLRRCLLPPSSGWSAWNLNARCHDNLKSHVSNVENPSCVFMFTHCIYCTVIQVNESTEYLDQQIKKTRLASKVTCSWYSLRSEFLLILKECPTRAVSRASARRQNSSDRSLTRLVRFLHTTIETMKQTPATIQLSLCIRAQDFMCTEVYY